MRGDYDNMPSAPYFHGYLLHLGAVLDFDGEEWWAKLKKEGVIKNSGELDTMPRNRFIKQSPPKYLWAIGAGILVLIYLAFQAPRIFGKPTLTVISPDANPYVTASSTFTLAGTVSGADSLYLVGANGGQEQIIIAADGSWQKGVLLGVGPNPFEISGKEVPGRANDRHGTDILSARRRHGADFDGQLDDNRLEPLAAAHRTPPRASGTPGSLTYF